MKTLKLLSFLTIGLCITAFAIAQTATETFTVSGNCGMCKSNIEKAAKNAGAASANWDKDKKMLTITYSSSSTNTAKIQQHIAAAGYDNAGFKANDEAYHKLHACCQYEREGTSGVAMNTTETKEGKMDCCKDGKMDCCKEGNMDCCKDGKMDCSKDGKMDRCKDGKKDCCRKS